MSATRQYFVKARIQRGDLPALPIRKTGGRGSLHATRTPAREAWLRHLDLRVRDVRTGRGNVPCHCARLGWTRWVEPLPQGGPWLEELTDEGRAVLREWSRA